MKKRYISVAIGLLVVALITIFGNVCKIRKVEVEFEKEPVSTSAIEIYENSKIEMGSSILSLNENVVKKNIMESYDENLVAVTDIVRVFPNKIIIYCVEHTAMVALGVKGESEVYALADGNFQLDKKVSKDSVDLSNLILIEGAEVEDTYNTTTFKTINAVFKALEVQGLDYNAQAKFISKISYGEQKIVLTTRDEKTLEVETSFENIEQSVEKAYQQYLLNAEF